MKGLTMKCMACGAENGDEARFCVNCGAGFVDKGSVMASKGLAYRGFGARSETAVGSSSVACRCSLCSLRSYW